MKNVAIGLMIAAFLGTVSTSRAEESLEARLASLEAVVKAEKSAKQANVNSAPATQQTGQSLCYLERISLRRSSI